MAYTNEIHLLPTTIILQTDDLQTSQLYDAASRITRHMNPKHFLRTQVPTGDHFQEALGGRERD